MSERETIPQIGRKEGIKREKAVLEEERVEGVWIVRVDDAFED